MREHASPDSIRKGMPRNTEMNVLQQTQVRREERA